VPPLREEDDLAAAWEGVADGTIDVVATDHAPHTEEEKRSGIEDIWKARRLSWVQTMMPVLLDAASRGLLGYTDIVRLVSENPRSCSGWTPSRAGSRSGWMQI